MEDNISLLDVLLRLSMASTDSIKNFEKHESLEEEASYMQISTRSFEKMQMHNFKDLYKEVTITEEKTYKSGKVVIKTRKDKVRGKEIQGRLKTFVKNTPGAKELFALCRLYQVWEPLRDKFMAFILLHDWPKFQLLTSLDEQDWLKDICELVIRDAIMIKKHDKYHESKGCNTFINKTIKALMIALVKERKAVGDKAEGVNAGFKDQGVSKKQIEEMYEKGDITVEMKLELIEKMMRARAKLLDDIALDADYRIEKFRKLMPKQSVTEELEEVQGTILEIEEEGESA